MKVVAQGMVERGNGGAIVNVSSQASKVALWNHLTYCSSKGAVDQATRVMALELGKHQASTYLILVQYVSSEFQLFDMPHV